MADDHTVSAEQAMRGLIDGFPDPVILLNERRQISAVNFAAQSLLGPVEIGKNLALIIRQPDLLAAVDNVLAGHECVPFDISLRHNVQRHFTAYVTPFGTDDFSPLQGVIVVLRDVTSARAADRMRADFVANVSHELRSPLATLIGLIETLQGAAKRDEKSRARFLQIMENEAGRMNRLISDLLSLSRVEAREFMRPGGTVDLVQLITDIANSLRLRAAARNIEIILPDRWKDERSVEIMVEGDRDELTIVFQNLLDNAIAYSYADTAIIIDCKKAERMSGPDLPASVISIHNRGDVIPTEALPRLTERFYRLDKARSRTGQGDMGGTGLGLAIVKHIINRHHGRLMIRSDEADGTVFTVFLPI